MTAQSKIDTEVEAMMILAKLIEFNEGYIWTAHHFLQLFRWDFTRIMRALGWLTKRDLVVKNLGSYIATEAGRLHYDGAVHKPAIPVTITAFRNEVLTGIKHSEADRTHKDWQLSDVDNAVLPRASSAHPPRIDTTPEDLCLKCEEPARYSKLEKKAAKLLKLTLAEFRKKQSEGLIRQCPGNGSPHLGQFNKNQTRCVECRRQSRKENRREN